MMKKLLSFLVAILLLSAAAQAQEQAGAIAEADLEKLKNLEDTIAVLGYAVVNEPDAKKRFGACRTLIPLLTKALKTKNSFNYTFDRLKTISIQYPKDSTFRIFTWQLYVDTSEYRHFGAIQMNQPELQLYPLIDRSFTVENVEQDVLTPDQWYGAIYYNIVDFDTPEGKQYLLFGLDSYSFFTRRKVIDVLYFKEGKPSFGAPVFVSNVPKEVPVKKRMLLEYSAEASVRCNYDEFLEMVIFDHLMTGGSPIPGQGMTNMPDGTFEGYRYSDGVWEYVPKVFDTVVDEPPRDFPILDGRSKDIFGKN